MTELTLHGQVAIVTGAARGLGRAYAVELARRGAVVVVNDLPPDGEDLVAEVCEQITAAGGRAVAVHESVGTPAGGTAIVDAALRHFGTVDIVVNNAGPLRWAPFAELPTDFLDLVVDVHLKGAFYVTQPAWRIMAEKGYGRVVMTSSNTSLFGMDRSSNYAAAKGGIVGLTRALSIEGAPLGIRVNAIMPAALTSERAGAAARVGSDNDRIAAAFAPLAERMGPEWTAALVAVLVSRQCPTTGETYSSVAGRYARVFTGVAQGWFAGDALPAAEDVLEHFGEVCDVQEHFVPGSAAEELEIVGRTTVAT